MTCKHRRRKADKPVPPELFGRDHWSTFAYAETRCVDHRGLLDLRHMRCNPDRHPLLAHLNDWRPSNGTRLAGFFELGNAPERLLEEHDDWDCLFDLEQAGLLNVLTGISGIVIMTPRGQAAAAALRVHKQGQQPFATFRWNPEWLSLSAESIAPRAKPRRGACV